jgi:DNA transposition AAA+ family ATPase
MVEANPQHQAGSLMIELLDQLGAVAPHGLDAKFIAVCKALRGTNYLLIIDEAENVSAMGLHYLRRINDKARVGIVLAGTPKLHTLIAPEHGQFDQIRSRVSMWPQTVETITRDDADDMARAALPDEPLPDDVLDALWAYGAGSARMLTESLVPALRDYAVGKLVLSAKVVDEIAAKVLFLKRRSAA